MSPKPTKNRKGLIAGAAAGLVAGGLAANYASKASGAPISVFKGTDAFLKSVNNPGILGTAAANIGRAGRFFIPK